MELSLADLLKELVTSGGSDLHLRVNSKPQIRVHGHLTPIEEYPVLTPQMTKGLMYSALDEANRSKFEEKWELDFSLGIEGLARFRVNLFKQKGTVGGVFRVIPHKILALTNWDFPKLFRIFAISHVDWFS